MFYTSPQKKIQPHTEWLWAQAGYQSPKPSGSKGTPVSKGPKWRHGCCVKPLWNQRVVCSPEKGNLHSEGMLTGTLWSASNSRLYRADSDWACLEEGPRAWPVSRQVFRNKHQLRFVRRKAQVNAHVKRCPSLPACSVGNIHCPGALGNPSWLAGVKLCLPWNQ